MIYDFTISVRNNKGIITQKQFYLSAKDKKEFYHRCASQYGATKDDICINREIEDESIDINVHNKLKSANKTIKTDRKGETQVISKNADDYLEQAKELMKGNVYSLNDKELMDKRNHDWQVLKLISAKKELSELIMKYDQVKLYYKAGTGRDKQYLALYK